MSLSKRLFIQFIFLILFFSVLLFDAYSADSLNIGSENSYYNFAVSIEKLINRKLKTDMKTLGAESSDIINKKLYDKKIEFAVMRNDTAFYAHEGLENMHRNINIRAIGTLYTENVHIIVRKGSKIKTVKGLIGKKVAVGDPETRQDKHAEHILESVGKIIRDHSEIEEAVNKLKQGEVDALFYTSSCPASVLQDITSSVSYKFISLDNSMIESIINKYPFYIKSHIPAGTYRNTANNVETIAVKTMLVARDDLSQKDVHSISKFIFENIHELKQLHRKWAKVSMGKSTQGICIPFHPGVEEYFNKTMIKVREKPYSISPVVEYIQGGTELCVIEEMWNMYQLQLEDGRKGWIQEDHVKHADMYIVTANSLNFRPDPSLNSIPESVIHKNDLLKKTGEFYNHSEKIKWYKVAINKVQEEGWVSARHVKRIKASLAVVKIPAKVINAGFVYVGTVGDAGWTFAHDKGRKSMEKLPFVSGTSYRESVPEKGPDVVRAIKTLVGKGCNLI
ncbi:MAG: TAXI family TRAP transporter solute-binding subunit, partial [Desulfobacterales bacterium]|nr:TAXI family TRAP transporter solute-binding subunit [Desulfobacterales bacterium]